MTLEWGILLTAIVAFALVFGGAFLWLRRQMADTFRSMASSALEGNNRQFLDLAKMVLEKESHTAQSDLEQKKQAIESLVTPLTKTLDQYQNHLRELEKGRERSYTSVENELKRIAEINMSLSKETTALKNALKRPHVRGRWGEVQLRNCVELAGMSEYADVTFQDSLSTEEGTLIPDLTVRMPGGRLVVVDAKTPIEAFIQSLEATNESDRNAQMLRHGKHVKEHVKKLSTRAYNEQFKDSPDFTVMFLPNESFLYAALENETDLIEFALEKKILIATPPTLIGLLRVIRFGWNEERLAENAERISDAGRELHKRICDFMDAYTAVGKSLEKATEHYEKGLSRLQSRVLTQAKRLESLGAKSKKSLPESIAIESSTPPP